MLEWLFEISWTPIVAAVIGVGCSSLVTRYWICRQKRETQQFLAGALSAEISLAFDSYVDYEFPEDLVDRRFEHQIQDVILFEPSLAVYQRNTDKLGIFHVNDTKKLIQLYVQIERLSRLVHILYRRVEEYKEAIRKSNNLPLNMNQNLPVPHDKIRQTMADIQSCKETAFRLRQDILDMLKKYQA